MIYELAAFGAAGVWALSNLVSAYPSERLGAPAFTRLRMTIVFVGLAAVSLATGAWRDAAAAAVAPMIVSGLIGIFIGDTALFYCMNRLGPRRTGVLFAMNAPIAVALGWLALDEALTPQTLAGVATILIGVLLAIVFGKRRSQLHKWESVKGPLWAGVGLGLVAAAGQAVGALVARPIMEAGQIDAVTASAIRVGVAAAALTALSATPIKVFHARAKLDVPLALWVAGSGFLGMGVGMTLLLFALEGGEVGVVSTLAGAAPALILPLIWIRTGERPAAAAWLGAGLVVLGGALIFI